MHRTLRVLLFAFLLTPFVVKADGFDDLMVAMRAGQASGVAKFFNSNVELTLLDNEGIYSKLQAEQMLKNFFFYSILLKQ